MNRPRRKVVIAKEAWITETHRAVDDSESIERFKVELYTVSLLVGSVNAYGASNDSVPVELDSVGKQVETIHGFGHRVEGSLEIGTGSSVSAGDGHGDNEGGKLHGDDALRWILPSTNR